jgi:type VI secretion system protein ImpF
MARPSSEYPASITTSALDRLLDDEPDSSVEVASSRSQAVRQLKEALRRDLEWLFNTRRVAIPPQESLKEVNRSVYIYGLPDFTSFRVKDQDRLIRILHSAIKLFEPRLANVRVMLVDSDDTGNRTVRLRIEGLLLMDPAPEHVSFDTLLELTSGEYEVKDAR